MQFTVRKRRQPPTVIIISLIDILIVLLIFLMVTTTFKQQPAVRIALPESTQAQRETAGDSLVITIAKEPPHFYVMAQPSSIEEVQRRLLADAEAQPKLGVVIQADKEATVENTLKVIDAAKAAKLEKIVIVTRAAKNGN